MAFLFHYFIEDFVYYSIIQCQLSMGFAFFKVFRNSS